MLISVVLVIGVELVIAMASGPFAATALIISGAFLWIPAGVLLLSASQLRRAVRASRRAVASILSIWVASFIVGALLFAGVGALTGTEESAWTTATTWVSVQWPFAAIGAMAGIGLLLVRSTRNRKMKRRVARDAELPGEERAAS